MKRTRFSGWSDHELLEEAVDIEDGLTEWEVEFVDRLAREKKEIEQGGRRWRGFSPRQRAKLEEILESKS